MSLPLLGVHTMGRRKQQEGCGSREEPSGGNQHALVMRGKVDSIV